MALWQAADLATATGGILRTPFTATGVSIDTRSLRPGDLFVALQGEARDGHGFVAEALARGAAGALVTHVPAGVEATAPLLVVGDTLEGLRALGQFARARFRGRLVAVTGSVGKTTTKEMLRRMLAAEAPTHAAEASYNNHWGVPLTLARLPADAAYCVVEIGMNHAGEIAPLARLARPHVALIVSVEGAHLGHLGSMAAIADEKAEIMAGLEPGSTAVLPADNPLLPRLLARAGDARVRSFGTSAAADARLLQVAADAEGTSLRIRIDGQDLPLRIAAAGRHMAMNATAALLAAVALGAPPGRAAAALTGFAPVAGRGARRRIVVTGGSALLLDESYNASPAAVRAALSVLALQDAARRVAVLGDMLELGEHGPAEHEGLAADVAASADIVFTCGPQMALLHAALPAGKRGAHAANAAMLAPLVAASLRGGDAVLVKGSLGSRMKTIVQAIEPVAPEPV
ncbi:UDP-N-acetylmuramoyl-tripeptide--D-alanyl-D-alanine ligase [Rhodovastum atsumiense]|uniref:UDP-N-acetylmuramoyl-tripeptide--D-alanyl-D-alanine ligase n=1 Tax=Rhodovastum atsumiense TaxID=504468 RepID=A0A5M6IZ54_9PROT|nr:UDP-N-acetylmuramoyl-tripeptide--D-alanyl-D-alanine ligase [Rhodovastum atsumiense]KAA5613583.1 UDP-N-acetylmuramoyl-tripeptide--D-alanyl-D-alanine ligase [Rhodovastum atsumiense]CAH2599481.1 UDP-N-acetylmuramoyl-tripeptide--D-alanyl-D-alanine ligase [Rhodovastum atsumiense]